MYKSYSKFRQQFKERHTIDLGAGLRQAEKRKVKVGGTRKYKQNLSKIQANIDKNKERLNKAKEALERQNQTFIKLEEKIADAWSDSFRERHEIWLEECKNKISDIKISIGKFESWIQEDEAKLTNNSNKEKSQKRNRIRTL